MTQTQIVVVAGGGLAGLSAAIELATHGHRVRLYEQSKTLGGRAATHSQQGFAMNIGPHGFYRAGMMKAQFDRWGIAYSGTTPLGKGDTYLIANGKRHRFPGNTAGLLRCGAFTVVEKLKLGQLLTAISSAKAEAGESMQDWIDRQSTSVNVRNMLAALTRLSTYSSETASLDAGAGLMQLKMAIEKSVLYLDGGWETVVNGLAAKAKALGVEIHTDCGVIAAEPGTVELRGVRVSNVAGIVLAMPPKAVEQVTGRTLPPMIPARAACLDLGLRRLPAKAGTFGLGLDEATYVSVHSEYASGLAPAGGALVQLAMYLGRGQSCTREMLEQRADLVMPGWREELVFSRFLPEMTVVHAIPAVDYPRPDVDALGMPSIAIAGDWVGPEAMLADAAVASGIRAARRLALAAIGKAA
ncbi:MAG TPA: FAD-dependent oxidoreductase [Bryobacteraceae bacterium]|jgi:phytoene dehydrogenase-like protein